MVRLHGKLLGTLSDMRHLGAIHPAPTRHAFTHKLAILGFVHATTTGHVTSWNHRVLFIEIFSWTHSYSFLP